MSQVKLPGAGQERSCLESCRMMVTSATRIGHSMRKDTCIAYMDINFAYFVLFNLGYVTSSDTFATGKKHHNFQVLHIAVHR